MSQYQLEKNLFEIGVNRRIAESASDLQIGRDFTTQSPPDEIDDSLDSQVDNLIDNSDWDFSKDAYLNSPTVGGDAAEEVYNFFRNLFIKVSDVVTTNGSPTINSATAPFKNSYTYPMPFVLYGAGGSAGETLTGTLSRVSDSQATLSTNALATLASAALFFGEQLAESSANAVKATAHSLFAANEGTNLNIPRWEKTNGWLELGSNAADGFAVSAPFALNVIRPGLRVFILAIISKRAGTIALTDGVRFFFGIWDNTAARNRWLEGDNFNLSVSQVGVPGVATDTYKAVAVLDDGSEIESNAVTIATSANTLSGANYNRLTWTNAPGILDFKLYRRRAGVTYRIFTVSNGAGSYNDTGGIEKIESSFPSSGATKAAVYKETGKYNPAEDAWTTIGAYLDIPSTYNTANTTDRQWLRFGTLSLLPLADNRPVLLDRLAVSFRQGGWGRSWRDQVLIKNRNPSSLPTDSNQGSVGVIYCFERSTLVSVGERDGSNRKWIPIIDVERGAYVWTGSRNQMRRLKKKPRVSRTKAVTLLVLANGFWCRATESEKFITSRADRDGTRLADLTFGDTILSGTEANENRIAPSEIEILEEWSESRAENGFYEVVSLSFDAGHIFAVGNMTDEGIKWALAHNLKDERFLFE